MRNSAPLDPLDDLAPPPPLPLIRVCGRPGCRAQARPGGRYCPSHFAAATTRWRNANRRAINTRRRDVAAARAAEQIAADSARAKLAMALKRGKIQRGACAECGAATVTAYIADPARWRELVWLCRDHRAGWIERRQVEATRVRERDAWLERQRRAWGIFEALPADERAQIEAVARRDPFGLGELSSDAPLYRQRLTLEIERRYASSSAAAAAAEH